MNEQSRKLALAALRSGIFYSVGLGVGNVLTALLFVWFDVEEAHNFVPQYILYIGLVLALLTIALGGFVGGFIGGWFLPRSAESGKGAFSYAWRSGIALAVGIGLVFYPLGWAIVLFSFYAIADTNSSQLALMFGGFGFLMGALSGLILGLSTIRKRGVKWVVLAGGIGFGAGGMLFGFFIQRFLQTMTLGDFSSGNNLLALTGLLAFGLLGGAAWGAVYALVREKPDRFVKEKRPPSRRRRVVYLILGIFLLSIVLVLASPVIEAVRDMVTPQDAALARVLGSSTIGTQWSDATTLAEDLPDNGADIGLASAESGDQALVWSDGMDVWLLLGRDNVWGEAQNVSNSANDSAKPQVVLDNGGTAHIVWQEGPGGILAAQCDAGGCSQPVTVSDDAACTVASADEAVEAALALDGAGNLLAVWRQGEQLLYRLWPANDSPEAGTMDCIPDASGGQPRLATGDDGRVHLAYSSGLDAPGKIHTAIFSSQAWANKSAELGYGRAPEIMVDQQDATVVAWCDEGGRVYLRSGGAGGTMIFDGSCQSRPALAQEKDGNLHLIWYGDEVKDSYGQVKTQALLYEVAEGDSAGLEKTILAKTGQATQPVVTRAGQGELQLAWISPGANGQTIQHSSYLPYNCDPDNLGNISQAVYGVARNPAYRPGTDIIPFCQNQYERLIYLPNAGLEFSNWPATPNGGYDDMAALIETAEYEVLFSTMWYDADESEDSPGFVIAEAVADLYEQLRQNPEAYPRGLTVRILLGNPPEFGLGSYSGQMWQVLRDLQTAGVDAMVDEELGWRLEVANFDGNWPHSHTKILVVDGKTVLAAGFNMQYEHYAEDHPSGLGGGRQDLGIQVTGPVAQEAHRVFADLWEGSDQQVCTDFNLPENFLWFLSCRPRTAVADSVPEVRKYYVSGDDSTVFSLYRSNAHDEADQAVATALARAEKSVDTMQVMFTMEMACDLNILIRVCYFEQAPGYLQGLIQAAENGAYVRLIVKPQPTDGIESFVAIQVFQEELQARGLGDRVEIRLFNEPVHYKTTLIDDEFLIVGSQNFHYSAFGEESGLTEYNLGVADPQAIADYQRLFARQWERAEPYELDVN